MKILVLGSNGMLGRYVYTYLKSKNFNVIGTSRKDLDVMHLKEDELETKLLKYNLESKDVIINCIGMIKQRTNISDIDFIYINAIFPNLLANICEKKGVSLVHPTTDCVFDGHRGIYTEDDLHNATDVYGKTKSLGESSSATLIRTSIIGEELGQNRSLIEWVKSKKGGEINGYINHIWNGITCLQFAKICEEMIDRDLFWVGVRHIYSNAVSKYQLTMMISDIYELGIKINPYRTEPHCDRSLDSKYNLLFKIPKLEEQIKELKKFNL